VSSGIGSVSYVACSAVQGTQCLPVGQHTISAYDSVEGLYGQNITISIERVPPSISISSGTVAFGQPDTISGAAPYYNDQLSVLINGTQATSGLGTVSYIMCNATQPSSCLAPGTYNVSVYDVSEGVGASLFDITVLPQSGSGNATSSAPSTTAQTSPGNVITTPAQAGASATQTIAEVIVVVVVIVILVVFILRGRNKHSAS
jgi:hypothetical protein